MMGTRHRITINGLDLSYYRFGQGKPLLFLHGRRVRALTFRRSLKHLSTHYTVIAPDIPGYGDSATPKGEWSFVDYAALFGLLLSNLDLKDVTLVGYSMGGGIALNLAVMSDRVSRLVLVDSSGLRAPNTRPNPHDLRRLSFYLAHPQHYATLVMLMQDYMRFRWKHRNDHMHMRRIRKVCYETSYENALARISLPTLLLWGEDDVNIPITTANEFQKRIPQAVLRTVKANHDWPLYDPLLLGKLML